MNQWQDDTLIAFDFIPAGYGHWRVLELPPRATEARKLHGKFTSLERAEQEVEDEFPPEVLVVDPQDIAEEIERRKELERRFLESEETTC